MHAPADVSAILYLGSAVGFAACRGGGRAGCLGASVGSSDLGRYGGEILDIARFSAGLAPVTLPDDTESA